MDGNNDFSDLVAIFVTFFFFLESFKISLGEEWSALITRVS